MQLIFILYGDYAEGVEERRNKVDFVLCHQNDRKLLFLLTFRNCFFLTHAGIRKFPYSLCRTLDGKRTDNILVHYSRGGLSLNGCSRNDESFSNPDRRLLRCLQTAVSTVQIIHIQSAPEIPLSKESSKVRCPEHSRATNPI